MPRTTLAAAKAQLKGIGYSIKSRDGEYIVTRAGEAEGDGSYYTNDLVDAIDTAWAMYHKRGGRSGMATRNPHKRESVASEAMLTHIIPGPGKFGGLPAAVEFVYDKIGEGWSHEEVGGDDEGFPWSALIINVSFGRKLASFVLQERSDGAVFAKVFTGPQAVKNAERIWDGIAADYDRHVSESGMYDDDGELIDDNE